MNQDPLDIYDDEDERLIVERLMDLHDFVFSEADAILQLFKGEGWRSGTEAHKQVSQANIEAYLLGEQVIELQKEKKCLEAELVKARGIQPGILVLPSGINASSIKLTSFTTSEDDEPIPLNIKGSMSFTIKNEDISPNLKELMWGTP